ncbi:hypothetical protein NMG60_11006453 [Bertholletia excelsa]
MENTNQAFDNSSNAKISFRHPLRLFQEYYPPGFYKKVAAEIIATYLLVFVTCGSAALSASDEDKVSKLGASVAGGLIVTVMIYAVGHISGAHMNPAVTLAFAAVRHFPWKQVPFYAAAQLTAATLAGFTLRLLLHLIKHVGTTTPSGSEVQALTMEIVVTYSMIVGELAGVAVGSAVCITSILAGPISGGSMNPARTIGPAVASHYYKGIWVSWSYNLIRVNDKPVQAISPSSFSFKLRRMRTHSDQAALPNDSLSSI